MRVDGREKDQLRKVNITNNYLMSPQGSVLKSYALPAWKTIQQDIL